MNVVQSTNTFILKNISSKIKTWLGLDRVVFVTVVGQSLSLALAPISLYIIGTFFSKVEQGYYYTFASVLALQNFLELGLSVCITIFASHEFANLQMDKDGRVYGDSNSRSRLIFLIRFALRWYGVVSILFFILVGTGGHLFFSRNNYGINWIVPWWSLCFVSAINIITVPVWAFLEGCNQYLWTAYTRIWTRIAGVVVIWLSIVAGAGLYSASLSLFGTILIFIMLFCLKWKGLVRQLFTDNIVTFISWKKEILPFQWKIALGWACGYFIFSLFTPVLFAFQGAAVAGQMGMTWAITSSLGGLASSWVNVKVSSFGMLVIKKEWRKFDELWIKSTIQSLSITIVGAVSILIVMAYIKGRFTIGERFLGYKEIVVLCLAIIVNQIIYCENLYMRAHGKEPFLKLFILNAILTGSFVYLAGRYFDALAVCVVYLFFITLSMILASMVFIRRKKEWHAIEMR